ncbi:hypothetical protein [Candidatus Poriferisodalis sp.]|uniref:hypothetical protein n=1 Tax=Candidatus Poriferisodalis sp. TaxID=3101277 RepID=UPI003B5A77EB
MRVVGLEVGELLKAGAVQQPFGVVEGQRDMSVLDVAQLGGCQIDAGSESRFVDSQHEVAAGSDARQRQRPAGAKLCGAQRWGSWGRATDRTPVQRTGLGSGR